ncbi:DUF3037 domain-containing protein [Jiella sonneratiae]|uniref:DUF3037 domain-containing protein n=1 Tax=Jiella sonneratiae TaxID=2816856 RepID=A0ABS3IXL5_9HYPH|nr:DUF3037 domain-containing protein [Jiella sonneratiae]MBO0902158.1 DUF3037 domain-containing protein [Jiella sonneratiae]
MTAKEPYSYVVLRYIHDVLTGEFVNVGLVMVVPDRSVILTKSRKTFGRIKSVFPDLDSDAYKGAIDAIDRGMKSVQRSVKNEGLFKDRKTASDYARIALPLDDSSLQWSQVGAGLTDDPQQTFDQLYQRFVSKYDRASDRRRSDDDVWRPVVAKLKEHGVDLELEPKRIQGKTDAVEFRHAWKNGRWHVYEPLSFDLSDADNIKDKARRWLGHLSAVKVGTTEDVQVHFIVGGPLNSSLMPAYHNAVEILRQVPFDNRVFDEGQIEDFVNQIEDDVRHHEGLARL